MRVRGAAREDQLDVLRVLDAANLAFDADTVEDSLDAGRTLVAVDDDRVVGALVAVPKDEGAHVEAIAVRRRRRASGVGSALVEAAADRWTPLTAEFEERVKPFYDALGFECEQRGERFQGVRRR